MTSIAAVGDDSERVGRELSDALTTPGDQARRAAEAARGTSSSSRRSATDRARKLDPPGPLRESHDRAIEALVFRVNGLAGLAEAFRRTQGSKDAAAAGALLASQAERLVASDVVWDDLFKEPADRRAEDGEHQRRRGARLELRPDAGPREHALDGADLGADQRLGRIRLDLGHAERPARHEHRVGEGRSRRPDAVGDDREHRRGVDRPRLRRHRREQRRQPGGQDRGDADDPAEPDADREEADDRHHQPGRDEDRRLPRLPVGRLRRAADHADRRRAGARARRRPTTTPPSTRSSSRWGRSA